MQRQLCNHCPVSNYCAVDALKKILQSGHVEGIWAGVLCTTTNTNQIQRQLSRIAKLPAEHPLAKPLTRQQRRAQIVLELHQQNLTAERIADHTGVSPHTVRRDLKLLGHSHLDVGTGCTACAAHTPI